MFFSEAMSAALIKSMILGDFYNKLGMERSKFGI